MMFREIIAFCEKPYETHKYSVWAKCNGEPTHTHIHTHMRGRAESDHLRHKQSNAVMWT